MCACIMDKPLLKWLALKEKQWQPLLVWMVLSKRNVILGGDSWVLSDIMPGIVRHHNPTKENSEDTA